MILIDLIEMLNKNYVRQINVYPSEAIRLPLAT